MAKMRKSRNASYGCTERGKVQIDVESNSEKLLKELEEALADEGFEKSCYSDETEYGTLWAFFMPSDRVSEFNEIYKVTKWRHS